MERKLADYNSRVENALEPVSAQEATAIERPGSQEPFLFRGGHLCLDFINTEIRDAGGALYDLLQTPDDLAGWLREAGVSVVGAQGNPFNPAALGQSALEKARQFRSALREVITAVVDRRVPAGPALGELNAVLRFAEGYSQIAIQSDSLTVVSERRMETPLVPLILPVAEAALHLLTGQQAKNIRRCESPACVIFFLDTSKNHSRRWCSMETCGNRHKSAAYYHRQRGSKSCDDKSG